MPENASDAVLTTMRIKTRSEVSKKEAVPIGPGGGHDYNVGRFISQGLFDRSANRFRHPDSGKDLTLKELIIQGFLNPYHTKVEDRRRHRQINLIDAIDEGIVDDEKGTIEDTASGRKYNIDQALREGLLVESGIPDAIEAPHGGTYNVHSGNFNAPGNQPAYSYRLFVAFSLQFQTKLFSKFDESFLQDGALYALSVLCYAQIKLKLKQLINLIIQFRRCGLPNISNTAPPGCKYCF